MVCSACSRGTTRAGAQARALGAQEFAERRAPSAAEELLRAERGKPKANGAQGPGHPHLDPSGERRRLWGREGTGRSGRFPGDGGVPAAAQRARADPATLRPLVAKGTLVRVGAGTEAPARPPGRGGRRQATSQLFQGSTWGWSAARRGRPGRGSAARTPPSRRTGAVRPRPSVLWEARERWAGPGLREAAAGREALAWPLPGLLWLPRRSRPCAEPGKRGRAVGRLRLSLRLGAVAKVRKERLARLKITRGVKVQLHTQAGSHPAGLEYSRMKKAEFRALARYPGHGTGSREHKPQVPRRCSACADREGCSGRGGRRCLQHPEGSALRNRV